MILNVLKHGAMYGCFIYFREGCMALYGPKPATGLSGARSLRGGGNTLPTYEIVVHSEKYRNQNLSVLRTTDEGK